MAWRKPRPTQDTPVDSVDDLREALIGDGLLLIPGERRPMRLYAVPGGRARSLGTFTDAVSAWQVLDAFDLESTEAGRRETGHLVVDGES